MATNSFAAMANGSNTFTRKWGTNTNAVDPYITGFQFIQFSYIPKGLVEIINSSRITPVVSDETQIKNILHSSNLSVNIPGKSMNTAEFTGLGGIRWSAPTVGDMDNTVSMRFLEASGLPVKSIFRGWFKLLWDSRAGVSLLNEASGNNSYSKPNYAANMYYYTTKPDGKTVEYACCFTGMFPTRDPSDSLSGDIASNDKLEIDMDWRFDYLWEEKWCEERCQQYANDRATTVFNGRNNTGIVNDEYRDGGV